MAKKKYASETSENKNIYTIFVIILSAFMLVIPFYKGLFFRTEYLPAIAFISIVFAAFMTIKLKDKSYKIINTYLDMPALLIPAAYLVSLFFAVNARDGFDSLLLYCSYFMLYKLVSNLSEENEKYKNIFINLIIVSTFMLSFTAMLNVAGIINLNGVIVEKRLFGLYQYANTSASVLGVGIILSLNKLIKHTDVRKIALYQMNLTALISSFIFTLSRGGYLVLAGVLLLNFLLIKAKEKLRFLLSLFISFLSSSILIFRFYSLAEERLPNILIQYMISIVVSAVIVLVIYSLMNRVKLKVSDKSINTAIIAMALIFIVIAVFLFSVKELTEYRIEHRESEEKSWVYKTVNLDELKPSTGYSFEFEVMASLESPYSYGILIRSYNNLNEHTDLLEHFESTGADFTKKSFEFATLPDTERIDIQLYNYESNSYTVYKTMAVRDFNDNVVKKIENLKYLPSSIADRLTDINLKTQNVSLRIYFMKDGLKIIRDYPIAGAGGGAWRNLYRQYQSMPYNTTEVHNFYVQYGTEVGIIGLVILAGLIVLLVISMIKAVKSDSQYLYVYIAAILLFLHSMIDFNLSLAAVGYILWMLIGIINSDKNTPLIGKYPHRYTVFAALFFALAICISSSSMRYGMKLGAQAAITSQAKMDVNKTIDLYKKAASLDRYNAIYRIDLAQILNKQLSETKDRKYYDGVMEQVSLIRKYEPYNHQYTSTICNIYLSIGKFEEVSRLADIKVQDEPLIAQSYSLKIDANFEIVKYYAENNSMQEAVPYLEKVVEAKEQLAEINSRLQEPLLLNEKNIEKIEAASKALEMVKAE